MINTSAATPVTKSAQRLSLAPRFGAGAGKKLLASPPSQQQPQTSPSAADDGDTTAVTAVTVVSLEDSPLMDKTANASFASVATQPRDQIDVANPLSISALVSSPPAARDVTALSVSAASPSEASVLHSISVIINEKFSKAIVDLSDGELFALPLHELSRVRDAMRQQVLCVGRSRSGNV